ncbi:putative tetratricopeptide-like helical domain superfamily [Helianthus annuus]|nr:putative tetratricopeptide-like helical domain superfamily [Helianthus annuus]KAJ0627275.1 putative tetratricopeptide-like helical domain superfamily [Helianthus annuus]KAJ0783578.1 putative tetratricopeptide-like helical domain superfamily [Helianthus annuus]
MAISSELYPSQDDLLYEEELLRNPFSLKLWWRYLIARTESPFKKRAVIYERALKALPGSYKLWLAYLRERLELEAAERLAGVLNDDRFYSIKGKTKHRLWLELCDLLTQHATEISGLNVDAIIRGGIRKFTDEVGRLWTSLADYYIRRKLLEKARDVFEEGMTTVVTVRDFSVIFDAYSQFEESVLALKMEGMDESEEEEEENDSDEDEEDDRLNVAKLEHKLKRFWLCDEKDVDLRIARLENLMDRRPELANSVLLRQNPHNVEQWHRRVKIFEGNPTKQILTYTEAVRTIDPMKAVGKPHTLWVAFAKLYEAHNDIANARVIFDKAVQVNYKAVDNLASVWCEWAEMELRHKNFRGALELMRRATAEPSVEVKRRVAADGNEPVQIKLHKSLRLWTFYVDLEESLGTLESTRAVYERILDLRIATPQIIINYAMLLEDNKYFEDAFKVYERGVKIFKYPHVKDIWVTYLSKFVKRYGKSKLERSRELFEHAVEMAPAEVVKPLYLQYAKLEEDYGLAKRAMRVYDQATKAVPPSEKLSMYEIYIARAAEIFGVPKTREIYEQAIVSDGLPEKDAMKMCIRYAELEKSLGEIDRARKIYVYASWLADPRWPDSDFWVKWHEFEVNHGNEDTFRDMLRIKRSVTARHSQTHVMLPESLMQKANGDETAMDESKKAEDEMAALERKVAPDTAKNDTNAARFVHGGVQLSEKESGLIQNKEEIELPEGSGSDEEDDDDDGKVEIAQKDVPDAVFGGLIRKRDEEEEAQGKEAENGDGGSRLGALERIKRMRQGN